MAPAQTVDAKDLPPELQGSAARTPSPAQALTAPAGVRPDEQARAAAPEPTSAGTPTPAEAAPTAAAPAAEAAGQSWVAGLERQARELLRSGQPMVWDTLTREFEAQLIRSALEITRGRRIEAAHKLGIGRNTITRKIQELGLED
jgi:two-component system nitrogen regulation response regulator GlnG